jgi:cytosine/adenosine deaminase-related metal-dependent hydrolase
LSTILLKNIHTLATFDEERRRLHGGWVLIRDDKIEAVGEGGELPEAEQRLDLTDHVVLPGLINLHHHFYQSQLRNLPNLQDVPLFQWLTNIFTVVSEMTDEDLYDACLVSLAQLMLSGCTTSIDHLTFRVNDMRFDTSIQAARDIGLRFHLARGSVTLGQSQGAAPPDVVVEAEDDILADTERLIQTYHNPEPGAMVRVDAGPNSPYQSSLRLMRESVALARKHGTGTHIHLATSPDEAEFVSGRYGKRSVALAEEAGLIGPDVWYAHAASLNDDEIQFLARTGTSICHCPNSNMFQSYGCCPVKKLLQAGVNVSLGTDGSGANNASNLLDEARNALLLQRVYHGPDALSATQVLEIATLGGARVLRRPELGVIAPGKMADLIAVDLRRLSFAGGLHDPLAALILTESGNVDLSIINGQVRVSGGQIVGLDLPGLIQRQNRRAKAMVERAEKRYGRSFSTLQWRRAFPYEGLGD